MKIVAVIYADLERDFFGSPSALAENVADRSALAMTLDRACRLKGLKGLDEVVLARPAEQAERIAHLVDVSELHLLDHQQTDAPAYAAMRACRAFGRYGWRGGLAGATVFDELFDMRLVHAAATKTGADALMMIPAGAVLLDVGWTSEVLRYFRENGESDLLCFNQAPPGLSAAVMHCRAAAELVQRHSYPGRVLGFDPSRPALDPIGRPLNRPLPQAVIATQRRFLAGTPRGLWLCRQIVAQGGENVDGESACRIAATLGPEPWPREITVELTTRRPVTDLLRPWTDRPDLSLDALRGALAGLEEAGDVNVMLAGCGDALLHPDWRAAVSEARKVGSVGLATYGLTLDESMCDALIASGADVVEVYVDALSEGVYSAGKQGGSAEQVWAGIGRLVDRRAAASTNVPMVVPCMLKTPEALAEQADFYLRCLGATGWCRISEPTAAAGQWDWRGVMSMAGPVRTPCRRIGNRLTLLSNGSVAMCEEDFRARHPLGGGALLDAWRGEQLAALRKTHQQRNWAAQPICATCNEFHRP